jgi:hypothetical protein
LRNHVLTGAADRYAAEVRAAEVAAEQEATVGADPGTPHDERDQDERTQDERALDDLILAERALAPPPRDGFGAISWECATCGYTTPGTVDQPFAGDGTCPTHERQVLRPSSGAHG